VVVMLVVVLVFDLADLRFEEEDLSLVALPDFLDAVLVLDRPLG
jgi:hypothetical protein